MNNIHINQLILYTDRPVRIIKQVNTPQLYRNRLFSVEFHQIQSIFREGGDETNNAFLYESTGLTVPSEQSIILFYHEFCNNNDDCSYRSHIQYELDIKDNATLINVFE